MRDIVIETSGGGGKTQEDVVVDENTRGGEGSAEHDGQRMDLVLFSGSL